MLVSRTEGLAQLSLLSHNPIELLLNRVPLQGFERASSLPGQYGFSRQDDLLQPIYASLSPASSQARPSPALATRDQLTIGQRPPIHQAGSSRLGLPARTVPGMPGSGSGRGNPRFWPGKRTSDGSEPRSKARNTQKVISCISKLTPKSASASLSSSASRQACILVSVLSFRHSYARPCQIPVL